MKQLLLATLFIAAACAGLKAQNAKSKFSEEQKKELKSKMDVYRAKLNLTEDQSVKVESINMDFYDAVSKIKSEGGSKLSRYKKFKQASRAKDKQMKGVLTASQYKIYQEQQQAVKEELRSHRSI